MDEVTILVRLLASTGLGALIGYERERAHKIAGLRTHAIVAVGSTLFTLASITGFESFIGRTQMDPTRIVSSIIVGIGFIGAGAILRKNERVVGTTTAASLWSVAAIGIAVGLGLFFLAITTTIIVYSVLAVLWILEKGIHKYDKKKHKFPEED